MHELVTSAVFPAPTVTFTGSMKTSRSTVNGADPTVTVAGLAPARVTLAQDRDRLVGGGLVVDRGLDTDGGLVGGDRRRGDIDAALREVDRIHDADPDMAVNARPFVIPRRRAGGTVVDRTAMTLGLSGPKVTWPVRSYWKAVPSHRAGGPG